MKKVLIIMFLLSHLNCMAQTSSNYEIQEKFVFHQLDILETETDVQLESFSDGGGMIIRARIEERDYMIISVGDIHTYNLTIINKIEDTPDDNIKVVMYQGGEKIEGKGAYTANVFFVYDLSKNVSTPEFVRFAINGSPNVMKYSAIIKLD